jgi:hypothetical protein
VLAASVVIGFGAAILWVAQGSFLTLCSPKGKPRTHTGIFWCVYSYVCTFDYARECELTSCVVCCLFCFGSTAATRW